MKTNIETVAQRIQNLVASYPGIQIRQIFAELNLAGDDQDTFFMMLVRDELYVDLEHEAISPNNAAHVFASKTVAEASDLLQALKRRPQKSNVAIVNVEPGTKLTLNGICSTIVAVSHDVITLAEGEGRTDMMLSELEAKVLAEEALTVEHPASRSFLHDEGMAVLAKLDTEEWTQVLASYETIRPYVEARSHTELRALPRRNRTQRRHLEHWRASEARCGCGLIGLLNRPRVGNKNERMDPRVREMINIAIDGFYRSKVAPSAELVWGICVKECNESTPTLRPPSRQTIYDAIAARDPAKVEQDRFGRRSAYSLTGVWTEECDSLSLDGEHAWSHAHIDHTQLDIETPATPDGLHLGRPWLTIMVSPRHRRILAMVLSYEPPSYRACMVVIRDCVRRHHRLPRAIIVDGGKEFESAYFEHLIARFQIMKKVRPPSTPRFGAVLERLNLKITSMLIHNMPGQTRLTKEVRLLMKEYDPKHLAVYPLPALWEIVEAFLFEFLDTLPDANTGLSPRQAFKADFERGGPRNHRIILPDERFRIMTMPTTEREVAKICRRSGVTINGFSYACSEFRSHELTGRTVPVRYDPDDLSTVYVEINDVWVRCWCKKFRYLFQGLTEYEMRAITQEMMTMVCKLKNPRRYSTAEKLATFMTSRGISPSINQIRARAAANKTTPAGKFDAISEVETSEPAIPPAQPYIVDDPASNLPSEDEPAGYVSKRPERKYKVQFSTISTSVAP